MSNKLKAFYYFATGAVAVALGTFELIGEPAWWQTVLMIITAVVTTILGKPWKAPIAEEVPVTPVEVLEKEVVE